MLSIDDYAALLLGILLLLLFCRIRKPSYFLLISLLVSSIFTVGLYGAAYPVSVLNAVFYWLAAMACTTGLWFVRVMLIRSVSLNALFLADKMEANHNRINDNKEVLNKALEEQMVQEISARTQDLYQQQVAYQKEGQLYLNVKGLFIAHIVTWLYNRIGR